MFRTSESFFSHLTAHVLAHLGILKTLIDFRKHLSAYVKLKFYIII